MFKKNLFIILLTVIIFSCSSTNPVDVSSAGDGLLNSTFNFIGSEQNLDIVTWNIENFPKNEYTVDYVKQCIDELNVDIIALQEITNGARLEELKESLGENWTAFKASSSLALAYLVNTSKITINNNPYNILSQFSYDFASRPPYVLEINYNNEDLTLINVHFKCCSDTPNDPDNSARRQAASEAIYNYISDNLDNSNVVVLGDFNDTLNNTNNVFDIFENDTNNFTFADENIANGPSENWSFPSYGPYGSHIDHILLTNELTDNIVSAETIKVDDALSGSFADYDYYISDHRPVGISLLISE